MFKKRAIARLGGSVALADKVGRHARFPTLVHISPGASRRASEQEGASCAYQEWRPSPTTAGRDGVAPKARERRARTVNRSGAAERRRRRHSEIERLAGTGAHDGRAWLAARRAGQRAPTRIHCGRMARWRPPSCRWQATAWRGLARAPDDVAGAYRTRLARGRALLSQQWATVARWRPSRRHPGQRWRETRRETTRPRRRPTGCAAARRQTSRYRHQHRLVVMTSHRSTCPASCSAAASWQEAAAVCRSLKKKTTATTRTRATPRTLARATGEAARRPSSCRGKERAEGSRAQACVLRVDLSGRGARRGGDFTLARGGGLGRQRDHETTRQRSGSAQARPCTKSTNGRGARSRETTSEKARERERDTETETTARACTISLIRRENSAV